MILMCPIWETTRFSENATETHNVLTFKAKGEAKGETECEGERIHSIFHAASTSTLSGLMFLGVSLYTR